MSGNNNTQHAAMHLHNELQRQGRVGALTWDERMSGPGYEPTWICIVYIQGVAYGTGNALTKQGARDEAASQALERLRQGN